jgi:hypothetical protein
MDRNPITSLAYAARKPKMRRWLPLGSILIAVAACIFALAGRFGPAGWNELRSWQMRRQWATCTIAADQVVLDMSKEPIVDPRYVGYMRLFPGYHPPERWNFTRVKVLATEGTIFLHEMHSPSGHRVLVCVDVHGVELCSPRHRFVSFDSSVYTPRGVPLEGYDAYSGYAWPVNCGLNDRLRFFAGQVDPKDPSHLTVRYDWNGVSGHIDGRLDDDSVIEWVPDRGTVSTSTVDAGWSIWPSTRPR